LLVAWAVGGRSLATAQEAAGNDRIARLVRDLGSVSYQVRENADRELARLGTATQAELEVAAASEDPEVRLRARELLRRLRTEQLWQARPVRIHLQGKRVSEIIPLFTAQTQNHLTTAARYEVFQDGPVNLDFDGGGYWQVLDELCRQSGNHFRPQYDAREKGVVLAAGKPGKNPVAYAGPLRVELVHARRILDDELTYKHQDLKRVYSFKLVFDVLWEDRLQLTAYRSQPRVLAAITDAGDALLATEAAPEWNVVGAGAGHLTIELKLQPPPMTAKCLASLLLEWTLLAVDDMTEVQLDSLAAGESSRQDSIEFTIESCQVKEESLFEATLLISYDNPLPEPPESTFQENDYQLLDEHGNCWRLLDQSHDLRGDLVRCRLLFRAPVSRSAGAPARLQIKYPRLRSQRDLKLSFRDVPLPPGVD
jgi:hypothetical protein